MIMETPRTDLEIIQEAAQAAERLLPKLEAERRSKLAEMESINRRLNQLQALIAAAKSPVDIVFEQVKSPSQRLIEAAEAAKASGRVLAGTSSIDLVLMNGPLKVQDIHKGLNEAYAVSTVYGMLNKGKKEGHYINENSTWRLSEKAMRVAKGL